jgi:hypothetical protein
MHERLIIKVVSIWSARKNKYIIVKHNIYLKGVHCIVAEIKSGMDMTF